MKTITVARARQAGLSLPASILFAAALKIPKRHRTQFDGHEWVVLTKPDWCKVTGLSAHGHRRALRELVGVGVFICEVHKNPRTNGVPTMFILVEVSNFESLEACMKAAREPEIG